jgi:hypothetical protein
VETVVKVPGREEERVGLILGVNMTGEALKTASHGYPRIFPRPLLQRHPVEKHRGTKNKR